MRTILFGVVMLAAASVRADWVKVTETGDTAYYVDPASISDKEDFRRVSVIQDYATLEPGGTRSRRVSYEVDCPAERLRSVAPTSQVISGTAPSVKRRAPTGRRSRCWPRARD